MKVRIGVSNRHVHLKKDDFIKLFGEVELIKDKDLYQPGLFASIYKVTIKTLKNEIKNVRVIGPFRDYTQIEISKTDAYTLGLNPPIRTSGDLDGSEVVTLVGPRGEMKMSILGPTRKATQVDVSLTDARKLGIAAPVRESGCIEGTPGCKLVGPAGEYEISEGVIAAKRHIHFTPENAKECGVEDKQIVSVKIEGTERSLTFDEVVVRVSENYAPAMHIDTDESNAAMAFGEVYGEIIK